MEKRYYVVDRGNEFAIVDRLSNSPFYKYFNLGAREADELCAKLNRNGWKGGTWFDRITTNQFVIDEKLKDLAYANKRKGSVKKQ